MKSLMIIVSVSLFTSMVFAKEIVVDISTSHGEFIETVVFVAGTPVEQIQAEVGDIVHAAHDEYESQDTSSTNSGEGSRNNLVRGTALVN